MSIIWVRDIDQDGCDNGQVDPGGIIRLIDSGSGWEISALGRLGSPIAKFYNLENAQRWAETLIQAIIAAYGPQQEEATEPDEPSVADRSEEGIIDRSIEDTIRQLEAIIADFDAEGHPGHGSEEGGSRASACEAGRTPGELLVASDGEDTGGVSVMGMVAARTRGGIGRLEGHLPGGITHVGLQATLHSGRWCREHAGRIIAALVDLGLRGELEDCEVWMQADWPSHARIVICKSRGELRLLVNDGERLRTIVDLPLLSGPDSPRACPGEGGSSGARFVVSKFIALEDDKED